MSKPKLRNYVAIVLDKSESMGGYRQETINTTNAIIRKLRDESLVSGQDTLVALLTFGDYVEVVNEPTDAFDIDFLNNNTYRPDGMTALYDGLGDAITLLATQDKAQSKYTSHLIIGVTDGGENQSTRHSLYKLKQEIRDKQETDRWTITLQVPAGCSAGLANKLGIPRGNVTEWETTSKGMRDLAGTTSVGLGNYYAARRAGGQSVQTFYTTTDLSDLTKNDVRSTLDRKNDFLELKVSKEAVQIKQFVEKKTRRPYTVGQAFYQLTKPEKVQGHKEVLLKDRTNGGIFGGSHARELVGLPTDGSEAKVTPGLHGQWDLFLQSTSTNRKLYPGTSVLVKL